MADLRHPVATVTPVLIDASTGQGRRPADLRAGPVTVV